MVSKYVGINIPRSLAKVLDDIVRKEGIYGARAALVKHVQQNRKEDYKREHKEKE